MFRSLITCFIFGLFQNEPSFTWLKSGRARKGGESISGEEEVAAGYEWLHVSLACTSPSVATLALPLKTTQTKVM